MWGIFCGGSWLTGLSSVVFCLKLSQCHWKSKGGSSYFIAILNYAILVKVIWSLPFPPTVPANGVDADVIVIAVDADVIDKTIEAQ